MKEGFYIKYVPSMNNYTFYYYHNKYLYFLDYCPVGEYCVWILSSWDKPLKEMGFVRVDL